MGLIVRQSLKSSLGFYVGIGLGAINTLFVSTQYLTPDQLAISRILLENSLIFAAFAHLGTPYIGDRFFSHFRNDAERHHGFLGFLLLFPLLGIALLLLGYWFFQDFVNDYYRPKSPTIIPYFWLSMPLTVCWIYLIVLETYCRNNARIAVPTFIREVAFKLINILLILACGFGFISYDGYLYGLTAALGGMVVLLLGYVWHLGKLYLKWEPQYWNKKLILEMAGFGVVVALGGVGANLVLFLDRNIIANRLGTTEVAIFTIAMYIGGIIEVPSKAIRSISGPILAAALQKNDTQQVRELYQKSALNLLLIGGITFLLVVCNIDSLLGILPKSEIYSQGKWVVVLIGLAKLLDMSLGLNIELITYSKYFRFNTVLVLLLAGFVVLANRFLLPRYGINGAAMATAATTLLGAFIKSGFVQWKYKLLPLLRRDWAAVAVLAAVGLLGYLIPSFGNNTISKIAEIGVKSGLMLLFFAFLVIRFRVSDDLFYIYRNQIKPLLPPLFRR